jgi:hypothetical protein
LAAEASGASEGARDHFHWLPNVHMNSVRILVTTAIASIAACGSSRRSSDCVPDDVNVLISTIPNGARTAVVFQTNGGATTSFGAVICVEERGRRRVVAVGYNSADVSAGWLSESMLRIDNLSYDPASGGRPRVVDVTSSVIACEPVRADWAFCKPDGTR